MSETIRQFFGGNFHQEWDLEADGWQGAVDNYAAASDPAQLNALAAEIDLLCRAHNEDSLKVLLPSQALAAYNPRPLTYTDWLGQLAGRLRRHAAN